jgi:hypothetical protein
MKYLGSICKRVRAVGMTECSKVKGSRRQHPPGQHGADRKKKVRLREASDGKTEDSLDLQHF